MKETDTAERFGDGDRHREDALLLSAFLPDVEWFADRILAVDADDTDEAEALKLGYEIRAELVARVAAGALEDDNEEETDR